MALRRRGSIRLWQTELFLIVIVVAMLILSGSLSAGLKVTLARMAETSELRNVSALARQLEPEFPIATSGMVRMRELVAQYRDIYGGGIWVYDTEGNLLESSYDVAPTDAVLESARLGALNESASYAASDLRPDGWVAASKSLHGPDGRLEGAVVTASDVDLSVAIMQAVRDRLWVTFWVSLAVAGLLGFGFSELVSRRIRAMNDAAAAMAAGDFEQRISAGFVPDEVRDLADSYNTMAATLGDAFGDIQESRRQIAAVVDSMAEGVIAFDSSGVVLVTNPVAVRLLAVPDRDLLGMSVETITTEPAVLEIVHRGLSGESASETVPLGQFTVLLHCTPLAR